MAKRTKQVGGATREWVTFDDPADEGRTWQVDVTFLLSSWECIFGCGCQGIWTEPTPELVHGCCTYGAHFTDKADREHVVRVSKTLGPDEWQYAKLGRKRGIWEKVEPDPDDEDDTPEWKTRVVDDACIFLNRTDFAAGPGCALHLHALNTGHHFSEYKPEVCWQVPLRRIDDEQDDGTVISRLTEFGRDGWGEGGDDFGWWCTEAPEAFTGSQPVYRSMAEELRLMLGKKLYRQVAAYLDERHRSKVAPPLLHPAEVPVALTRKHAGTNGSGNGRRRASSRR
jgi:hypothetical protein